MREEEELQPRKKKKKKRGSDGSSVETSLLGLKPGKGTKKSKKKKTPTKNPLYLLDTDGGGRTTSLQSNIKNKRNKIIGFAPSVSDILFLSISISSFLI